MMWFKRFIVAVALVLGAASPALPQAGIQTTPGQIVGNSTASTRPARAEDFSAVLDRVFGSVRGSIIKRGASAWSATVPGASGTLWMSNGVGADPTYQFFQPPIVILVTGQSNIVQRVAYSWSPAPNANAWNWNLVDGSVGTAFAPLASNSISIADRFASVVAAANPSRQVYVVMVAFSAQTIAHWMVGSPAPDVYANIQANIVPALAAAGVTKIDALVWWQGENQTDSPELYPANFDTVMARFQGETWFPRSTPVTVFSVSPSTQSGQLGGTSATSGDATNALLQQAVRNDPDTRRFLYTGELGPSYWADTLHPNALGTFVMGEMAALAYLRGETHQPVLDVLTNRLNSGSTGRPAQRNLVTGGDFTTNPWRYGTSFVGPATGTTILDNWTYESSGTGVVSVLKTADAPTIAQAGQFTQHSLHVDVTTADAALAATDYYGVQATVTGGNSSFLGFGQTSARSLVVSFWAKHTITGNYFVAIENSAQNRSWNTQYTINAADTWEFKRVVIQGDAAGTWLYTPTGVGLRIFFTVAAGDNFLFTPDVWNIADVRVGNATRANGMSSTANNFKLALVQVEEGLWPSAYDRVPYVTVSSISELGLTAIAFLTNPTSANLRALLSDETGTGVAYFQGGDLGTPSAGVATNITGLNATQLTTGTVPPGRTNGHQNGTATNDAAAAGEVGEFISSSVASGSAVSLTTITNANVTSISLTAGDWDVSGFISFNGGATTQAPYLEGSISTTSATPDYTIGRWCNWQAGFSSPTPFNFGSTGGSEVGCALIDNRISLSATTTVYLVARAQFSVSSAAAFGIIRARRAR